MKLLCLFALNLLTVTTFAGGFIFPNTEYSYAKTYLFNTGEEADKIMPEFSIYRDGIYAQSKLGNGWDFSEQMNAQMNSIFRLGVDAMATGLSGCYTPRHGIIYFDKTGKPVASISICFECQRVTFWSITELPEFKPDEYSARTIAKTEKQFADLEALFVKSGVPVFTKPDLYRDYTSQNDSLYSTNGEMILEYTNTSAFGTNIYSVADVKGWIIKPGFQLKEANETRFSQREGDTRSWDYLTLISNTGTKIIFTSTTPDAILTEATIANPEIRIPNGISVGMSLEQVQNSFPVWDGIAWPTSIVVNYSDATVRYLFKNRTLGVIEVVMF